MLALMEDFSSLEKLFAFFAAFGGGLFIIRMILMFVGGDADMDTDVDVDIDGDVDVDSDMEGGDTDISFRLLSFQGLTAFFMMFGLVGLALSRQNDWGPAPAIAGGTFAGLITCWLLKWIFDKAKTLQSSGNIKLENAVGQEGTVYLNIPANGTGKAQVTVQDHLKVYDAVSQGDVELHTGDPIKVVRIISNNTLVVEKLPDISG
jgi:membrane protein implicated in regulation of membrane protease activity